MKPSDSPMNDNNTGLANYLASTLLTFFAWVTIADVQLLFTLIATICSIVCSIFAARYYWKKK